MLRPFDGVYWVWVQGEDHQPFSTIAHLMALPADPLVMRVVCRAKIFRFRVSTKYDEDGMSKLHIPEAHAMCKGCKGMWKTLVYAGVVSPKDIPTEYPKGGE